MHGATTPLPHSTLLARIVLTQHSAAVKPSTAASWLHSTPPHWLHSATQQASPTWRPGMPLLHSDVEPVAREQSKPRRRRWSRSISNVKGQLKKYWAHGQTTSFILRRFHCYVTFRRYSPPLVRKRMGAVLSIRSFRELQ